MNARGGCSVSLGLSGGFGSTGALQSGRFALPRRAGFERNRGVDPWYQVVNADEVPSPSLLIFPERVEENLRRMIAAAGGAHRLRPHVKTHKLPQILAMQIALGITRFKAATIAEAEMCAMGGANEVLLAYPMVGPNPRRLVSLIRRYPGTRFQTVVDHPAGAEMLSKAAVDEGVEVEVLIDLNVGMDRTGIAPSDAAFELYRTLCRLPGIRPGGLHAYDGHLHQADRRERQEAMARAFDRIWALETRLKESGLPVPRIVASGTPTTPLMADRPGVELGAGTTVLWDFGQAETCPDMDYLNAAVLLARVVSRPTANRITLDLGHKAVASEMAPPRVRFFGLEEATPVMHSEEHLVLDSPRADQFPVGTVVYGIPRHVCPTVALHSEVTVVRSHRAVDTWPVVARARRITI